MATRPLAAALVLVAATVGVIQAAEIDVPRKQGDGVDLTIYESNLALIKDRRSVTLPAEIADLAFTGVSGQMQPETALVRIRREGNWIELQITDTGVGMTPEQRARCFEEYWSDKKGGTGLGLSSARRTIEEHGGTIHVVSEPGRGTSFSIFLPAVVEITRTAPAAEGRTA